MQYQWEFDGTNLANATNSTLTLTNVQSGQEGNYQLSVTSAYGSITSSNAAFTLLSPPVILSQTQPTNQAPFNQTSLTLDVTVSAPDQSDFPLGFQWQLDGTDITGATSSNYTVTASAAASGTYSLTITNSAGSTNVSWQVNTLFSGNVVGWGVDDSGESDAPSVTNAIAIAAGGFHSLLVEDGGDVIAWGNNTNGQTNVPAGLSNVVAVAAGEFHSLAMTAGGSVVAWGDNTYGETNVPPAVTGATAISAGGWHCLALLSNTTVVQWGLTNTAIPSGVSNVTAIASGTNFDLALLQNSTVVAWGANGQNQTNVPSGLSNVVAIAAGGSHALALQQNGLVIAWGSSTNVPAGLSNVMAIAAGDNHSLALKNDGTVVVWGQNSDGQTNVPGSLSNVKLIAAGGNHSLAGIFSTWIQYPVNVANDLLLVYNTNSTDSATVLNYYLQKRPGVSNANVLAINFTQSSNYETISPSDFTNVILNPITNWLASNPTKRPQYVILFLDIPSRVNTNTTFEAYGSELPSVSWQLATCDPSWFPFVMHMNLGASNFVNHTNDCIAYINKLAAFGSNFSPGKLIISASRGGYGNTNYFIDDTEFNEGGDEQGLLAEEALVQEGVSTNSIAYTFVFPDCGSAACHITNGTNVAGYFSWGGHSTFLGPNYPIDTNKLRWNANSGWYIIQTEESFNGRWSEPTMGNFIEWYSSDAFGGVNYSNTPVGAVSNTDEPELVGNNDPALFFGLWESEKNFAICAWVSRLAQIPHGGFVQAFQAVGDPFVIK